MSRPRPKLKLADLKRPTLDTRFHIDYDWWSDSNLDLKTFVYSRLEIGDEASLDTTLEKVDLIDPETGEVRQVNGFQYALQTYLNQLPDDFARHSSLVDAVFYVLLANANKPMSVHELAEAVGREAALVLKTIAGPRIYQGIRPIFDEN